MTESRIIRSAGAGWHGVEPLPYKSGSSCFPGTLRHELIVSTPHEAVPGQGFEVRCFSLAAGAQTSLERHDHAHSVIVMAGRGTVRLGDSAETVEPFDAVYIAPQEVHRFAAGAEDGLTFLCIVDRDRDRPVSVDRDRPMSVGADGGGVGA